jgi:hypothetical protein
MGMRFVGRGNERDSAGEGGNGNGRTLAAEHGMTAYLLPS